MIQPDRTDTLSVQSRDRQGAGPRLVLIQTQGGTRLLTRAALNRLCFLAASPKVQIGRYSKCYTSLMQPTDITFLGTGDAFSAGGRHQAAYLVRSPGSSTLLDCAPTTLSSFKRSGLSPESVDRILLSHFHGDHFGGLPFFFLEYVHVEPRRRPLQILGPPGVEEMVMLIFRAMYPDSASEPLPYPVQFTEAHPGQPVFFDGIRIKSFLVPHQNRPVSLGYEMLLEDRKLVYSGDTGWTEDLLRHTQDADLFICECTFFETRMPNHLDYPRLAENHARFGSKRIVLTHLGHEVLRRQGELELEQARDSLVISL